MAAEIFVDTSGFFAMLDKNDARHAAARRVVREAQKRHRRFIATDYILGETATLLKARRLQHLIDPFFLLLDSTLVCRIEWTDADRFQEAKTYFVKHGDHEWSFTDCLSFCVMSRHRLRDALTTDRHFQQAGFNVLLK